MSVLFKLAKWLQTRALPAEIYTKIIFKKIHKYPLNLDNPKTLNEKLHWMKLRGPKFISPALVDKYHARAFIREAVGEQFLVPLIAHYDSASEFILPDGTDFPVIVKTTHDSGLGLIYHKSTDHELNSAREILAKRLKINHYHTTKEYPYKPIKGKIIVEKLLSDEGGALPNDYKFHFFNGELEFIYCTIDRAGDDLRQIFDRKWNRLDMVWNKSFEKFDPKSKDLPKPENLEQMIDVAKSLASGFPYVRIDLYNISGKIFCGELTFFQGSGFDRLTPYAEDLRLGGKIDINEIEKIEPFIISRSVRPTKKNNNTLKNHK